MIRGQNSQLETAGVGENQRELIPRIRGRQPFLGKLAY
jgi:hypothetical protein